MVYNFSFAFILRITQNERFGYDERFIPLRCVIYMNSPASHRIECLIFVNLLVSLEILTCSLELENKISGCSIL